MSKSARFLTFLMIPVLAGCQQTKSANPLSPMIAGPIAGVFITPPKMLEPTSGRGILDTEQPVVLVVGNSTTTGVRPVKLRFEVAADAGFSAMVVRREGVPPGDASTRLVLGDRLPAGRNYYWRVQADDGANKSDRSPRSSCIRVSCRPTVCPQRPGHPRAHPPTTSRATPHLPSRRPSSRRTTSCSSSGC